MTFHTLAVRRLTTGLLTAAVLLGGLAGCARTVEEPQNTGGFKIGYAEGVTVTENPNALQDTFDEMVEKAKEGYITLEFKNTARSTDGLNFSCYLANADKNTKDAFFAIYADSALTDELYLSGLLRPGTAFDQLTLNHDLPKGTNTVYVVQTQVEEDLETICGQMSFTMDFVVS